VTATLFFRLLKEERKEESLRAVVRGLRSGAANLLTHSVEQESFRMIPRAPFAYWVSDAMRHKFKEFPRLEGNAGYVHVGLQTSDDFRFLRAAWEVPASLVGSSRRDTNELAVWALFAKGGEYSPYYADVHLAVCAHLHFAEIVEYVNARYPYLKGSAYRLLHADSDAYFRPGLTWPLRTQAGLSMRAMPAGCVFGHKGPAVLADNTKMLAPLLAVLNSLPGRALVDLLMAFGSYEVGVLQRVPIPEPGDSVAQQLGDLALSIYDLKRSLDTATESSHAFLLPAILQRSGPGLAGRLAEWNRTVSAAAEEIVAAQREIDETCYRLYGISAGDRSTIEAELGTEVRGLPGPLTGAHAAAGLVSWAVGVVLGRFDVRLATGERPIPALPDPFDPLPAVSPGMLPDGRVPSDYPVVVAHDGILVDDEGHPDDLVGGIREVLHVLWKAEADGVEKEACELLGVKSLRDYLGRTGKGGFWDDHFRRYSKSRRCAPIYWPLQSPRNLFRVWLYAHRMTSDTLPKLLGSRYLGGKLAQVKHAIEELRPAGQTKPGLTKREERRLAELDELLLDLGELAARLRAVMGSASDRGETVGYAPDLDDGIALTAAALYGLIPWPKTRKRGGRAVSELQAYWEELAAGEHDWSHVAMLYWPARVTEKCRTDKSLALAHGLDAELFPGLREELLRQPEPATAAEVQDEDSLDADEEEED
jgi:hypothetical protein